MDLREVVVEPVALDDEQRYQCLMQAHHYLGALPKIGQTVWYVGRWHEEWVALIGFSSPAWKCRARDAWIGWNLRVQYDRLHLLSNNSRFVILPRWRRPNLASRVLALCERRVVADWPARFGHRPLMLETFVDPSRFHGTVYRAANWQCVGHTCGYRRVRGGYSDVASTPKLVFVRALSPHARARLTQPVLDPLDRHGRPKMMLAAHHMRSLPELFADIDDPRRQGRRHPLPTVLAIATAATLCDARTYQAMANGLRTSPNAPANDSVADTDIATTTCPASSSSATCSCASTLPSSTAPCSDATPSMAPTTKRWPSTARRCATPSPSTKTAPSRPTS